LLFLKAGTNFAYAASTGTSVARGKILEVLTNFPLCETAAAHPKIEGGKP
jgi:hypothetical protein